MLQKALFSQVKVLIVNVAFIACSGKIAVLNRLFIKVTRYRDILQNEITHMSRKLVKCDCLYVTKVCEI